MIYRAIGLMSGSSLDGLDIAFTEFQEQAGTWKYEMIVADCYPYPPEWLKRLTNAGSLSALDYQLLHTEYGHYIGQQVNIFIDAHQLQYKVSLIASHGHTVFHLPAQNMTAQLGDGAAIAAETKLPVVTDLRALDIAFGGQGAPIVPIGEKLLLKGYDYFLNLGGIANISRPPYPNPLLAERASKTPYTAKSLQYSESSKPLSPSGEGGLGDEAFIAFDVCPANRVLNMLANELGKEYDEGGQIAANGTINSALLEKLNALDYYQQTYPKSLANDFGTQVVYPIIQKATLEIPDALATYTEHIALQIRNAISSFRDCRPDSYREPTAVPIAIGSQLLATGGGALNTFLVQRLRQQLETCQVEVIVPDTKLVNFKEALIMAFIGVLRWRQEYNVLSSVTGAIRDSIGGALWSGQEA